MKPKAYRLPKHTLPQRYDIRLHTTQDTRETRGDVTIRLDVREATSSIEIHAMAMRLTAANLDFGGRRLQANIEQDEVEEMAFLRFDDKVPSGPATLRIEFEGKVRRGLRGLYLAKDGPEQCLCTQCEETDARSIFPCFDEPAFKASFAWEITTAPDQTVLTNGPLLSVSDTEDGKWKTWKFAPTKPMSSYLCGLVIGDFASTPEETVDGTPLRVYALRGKEHMGRFAQAFTGRLLSWYERYFGVPYHYDKYDQVAVPAFAAGAMENSGIVLFRQARLLIEPQTASWSREKSVAHVVAHEFAHMWFGNYVTMKWWDDLWLNEAFAEWISIKACDELEPSYEMWTDSYGGKSAALSLDALENTHPIYSPVETPAEASELFDSITYQKGSACLRMIENFIGEENFRAGLRTYMQEFAEGNAAGADLWRHLQKASDHPVTGIMESWIRQGGYPVLSLSLDGNTLRVGQRRFFSSPGMGGDNEQLWCVPLVIRYKDAAGEHVTTYLLTEREAAITLDAQGEIEWLDANVDQIGFYRQQPDETLLGKVLANVDCLTPLEQLGLLGDQWAFVQNGDHSVSQFLDVISALTESRNRSVTGAVINRLATIEDLLKESGDAEALAAFREWTGNAYREQMAELGFEPGPGEAHNEAERRAALIEAMAGIAEDPATIEEGKRWAAREAADPRSVDPNVGNVLVDLDAWFADDTTFERHMQIYDKRRSSHASPAETDRYLDSFSYFRTPDLVRRTFDLIDDRFIPQEAIGPVLRQALGQLHAREQAWEWMKEHWQDVTDQGGMWLGRLVALTGNLPVRYRGELVDFYGKNLNGLADRGYLQALETIDQLEEFKQRTCPDLVAWCKSRS